MARAVGEDIRAVYPRDGAPPPRVRDDVDVEEAGHGFGGLGDGPAGDWGVGFEQGADHEE